MNDHKLELTKQGVLWIILNRWLRALWVLHREKWTCISVSHYHHLVAKAVAPTSTSSGLLTKSKELILYHHWSLLPETNQLFQQQVWSDWAPVLKFSHMLWTVRTTMICYCLAKNCPSTYAHALHSNALATNQLCWQLWSSSTSQVAQSAHCIW